jgi:hypothetical protein
MMLPSDNQTARDNAKLDGPTHPEYEILGRFEPRDARRILKRLEEEDLSFEVKDCSEVRPDCTRYRRRNWLCIYIRPEHKDKAEAIVVEGGSAQII